jgi:hypothetical protein
LALAATAAGQETDDASSLAPTFQEGDVITLDQIEKLRPFLPEPFWDNRDFFFYEGMRLEIGPTQRDYSPSPEVRAATEFYRGQARIGPDNSLENWTAGRPFPIDEIDCRSDPQAGVKIMWDFQSLGGDGQAHFFYSYWDRGERLPLYYEGTGQRVQLANRFEEKYREMNGDIFRGEKRKFAFGAEVVAPFDARGIQLLTYRYKKSDRPRVEARNDDTWVYVPTLRRVRRISSAQRTDAIAGTDFTFDDLRSFNGIIPQYEWECLGEGRMIGPMNTKVKGYPYEKDHSFGPYGLSFADDRWELRDVWLVRMTPKNQDHPYHHKDVYIDQQTLRPQGRALEDHLAQQALEPGRVAHGRVVPGLEGGPESARTRRGQRHHRQRPDRHGQPHRVLGRPRYAARDQGQDPPLHRRRAPHQGPLSRAAPAGSRSPTAWPGSDDVSIPSRIP